MTPRAYSPPPAESLRFIEVDATFAVISKPAGLLSVPGRGPEKSACAQSYVKEALGQALIVHRLDMDTSGLMVFARTAEAQRVLSIQFQERAVQKTYEAVVAGCPDREEGVVDLPIARYSLARPRRHVALDGQEAITRWRLVSKSRHTSRLSLNPETGRSHQLRLHLSATGLPILGDPLYGDPDLASRLLLHATQLAFACPETGRSVRASQEAPF